MASDKPRRDKDMADAYRDAAQHICQELMEDSHNVQDLKVNRIGAVQPCEGGAYVETILWVPRDELRQEKT